MQITRHWRLSAQRYRLEGVRLEDGSVSLQSRLVPQATAEDQTDTTEEVEQSAPHLQRMAS